MRPQSDYQGVAETDFPLGDECVCDWSSPDINDLGPEVVNMVPVTLKSGEQAYLATVEYQRAGPFNAGGVSIWPSPVVPKHTPSGG